jgi:hypothetical protein
MSDSLSWNASIILPYCVSKLESGVEFAKVRTSDLLSGEYTWQAVSFVQSQADEELWEELINQSMHNPAMVWSTLKHSFPSVKRFLSQNFNTYTPQVWQRPILASLKNTVFTESNSLDDKAVPYRSHCGFVFQIGSLLENTVGHIDPLHVVEKVPAGMPIPR